jgi:hypothetical protein
VPVLPLIDLMILLGSLNLGLSVIIRVIIFTTHYRPSPFGLTAFDFVVIAVVCFVFALTLAARSWVKLNESRMIIARRDSATAQARLRVAGMDGGASEPVAGDPAESDHEVTAAERR